MLCPGKHPGHFLYANNTRLIFVSLSELKQTIMDRQEFIDNVKRIAKVYSENVTELTDDPQLRVNPMNLRMSVVTAQEMQNEIAYTDEDIDVNAAAEGDESESSDDYEAKQDPDFYPLRELLSDNAIEKIAENYFNK